MSAFKNQDIERLLSRGDAGKLKAAFNKLLRACIASIDTQTPHERLVDLLPYLDVMGDAQANRLAVQMRKRGASGLASEVYDRLLERSTSVEAPLLLEALATFKRAGQTAKVAELVESSERLLGDTIAGRIARAELHAAANDLQNAHKLLEGIGAVERDGTLDAESYLYLANIAFRIGALDRTAWLLDRARQCSLRAMPALDTTIERLATALDSSPAELAERYEANGFEPLLFAPEVFYGRVVAEARPIARPDARGGLLLLVNSLAVGGSERNAISMANAFAAREHFPWVKMAVVDGKVANPLFSELLDSRVEIVAIDEIAIDETELGLEPALRTAVEAITPATSAAVVLRMIAAFKLLQPEVVHAYAADVRAIQAATASVACGIPVIMNPGGFTPIGRGRGEKYQINMRWMRSAYHMLLRHPLVRMMNPSLAASMEYARWIEVSDDCLQVNYYGLDLDAFLPDQTRVAALRDELDLHGSCFVVGGVFRFEEVKRPLLWLDTAAVIVQERPDARFVLVGDGELLPACKAYAETLGIAARVVFAGRQLDPVNWYALMSAYLQTSSSEGLGNVLIEAQAAGVPVVVPPIGGMPETLLHGRTGWIASDDAPASLAQALLVIAENQDWREQAAGFARMFVRTRFGFGQMVEHSARAYERLEDHTSHRARGQEPARLSH